jgi:hypothetical protein
VAGVAIRHAAIGRQDAIEQCGKPRIDRTASKFAVDSGHHLRRSADDGRIRGEHPLDSSGQQRRWWTLPRNGAEDESKPAVWNLEAVEKVATDGTARR